MGEGSGSALYCGSATSLRIKEHVEKVGHGVVAGHRVRQRSTIFVALPPSAALASGYVVAEPSASRFGGTIGGSRRSAFPAMCSHGHQMLMTMPPLVSFTHTMRL